MVLCVLVLVSVLFCVFSFGFVLFCFVLARLPVLLVVSFRACDCNMKKPHSSSSSSSPLAHRRLIVVSLVFFSFLPSKRSLARSLHRLAMISPPRLTALPPSSPPGLHDPSAGVGRHRRHHVRGIRRLAFRRGAAETAAVTGWTDGWMGFLFVLGWLGLWRSVQCTPRPRPIVWTDEVVGVRLIRPYRGVPCPKPLCMCVGVRLLSFSLCCRRVLGKDYVARWCKKRKIDSTVGGLNPYEWMRRFVVFL